MRKWFLVLIPVFVAVLAALSACSNHTHTPSDWSADLDGHWHVCTECNEKFDFEAHALNKNAYCSICKSDIHNQTLTRYDQRNNICLRVSYLKDGTVASEDLYEREYFENGSDKHIKTYRNGVLKEEYIFIRIGGQYGEIRLAEEITYKADGSKKTVLHKPIIGNTMYDHQGLLLKQWHYRRTADGEKYISREIFYVDGIIDTEETYFEDGKLESKSYYHSGFLLKKTVYRKTEEGKQYRYSETVYAKDGSIVSETKFAPNGSIIED